MIFVLRAIMVSMAFFAIVYSFLSVLLVIAWWALEKYRLEEHFGTDVLFALRLTPFGVSAAVSLFLTFPSFLLFERHSLDEDFGTFVLAACAALILGTGIYRVFTSETRTRRVVSTCMQGAIRLQDSGAAPAIILAQSVTPLMLVGVRTPRILIASSAYQLLSDDEFQAAIRHETAHSRSRDNLKKAILNCLPFPGMRSLEKAWQEASEFTADDGAVSSRVEALDLAAALIKLARHYPCQRVPNLATGLVSASGSVTNRVKRLMEWDESLVVSDSPARCILALASIAFVVLTVKLGSALILVHSLTERLVP